jgi:hypothetical protein
VCLGLVQSTRPAKSQWDRTPERYSLASGQTGSISLRLKAAWVRARTITLAHSWSPIDGSGGNGRLVQQGRARGRVPGGRRWRWAALGTAIWKSGPTTTIRPPASGDTRTNDGGAKQHCSLARELPLGGRTSELPRRARARAVVVSNERSESGLRLGRPPSQRVSG